MKKQIILMFAASAALLSGCHKPDELTAPAGAQGLTSVSAQFASGDYKNDATAKFTTLVTEANMDRIVIDVPWFYPENSDNRTSITQMRVTASLEGNCFITPKLGTLDLTQENYFTLTRADGSTRDICIAGNIKKSDKCELLSFLIDDPAISGVIDNDAEPKTVSLISIDDLQAATASVVLSPHATISPDPTQPQDYNDGMTFTVTAYDGVSKATYKVAKVVPPKIKHGWRAGSEKEIWVKDLNLHYGLTNAANANHTVGVMGNSLVLSTSATQYEINAITGEMIGEITGHMDLGGGAITSDKAGHLLMCNVAAKNTAFTVYTTTSTKTAPTPLISWTYNIGVGVKMGMKISVQGDITKNAIITVPTWAWANPASHREFIRWIVTDGVVGQPEAIVPTGCVPWNSGNTDVAYATTDLTAGYYFVTNYGGTGNKLDAQSAATNEHLGQLATPTWGANSNFNAVDAVAFNNAVYEAVYGGMHFSYSQCIAYMHDVTSLSGFTGTIQDSPCTVWASTEHKFGSPVFASSDILMVPSSDGYKLRLFYTDGNCRSLAAWEFDCIDK